MSVNEIGAWCGGIVGIITAISTLIVTIRTAIVQAKDAIHRDDKLAEIHVLVNSRLSQALDEIAKLRNEVSILKNLPAREP
jgi:hypothetical protein